MHQPAALPVSRERRAHRRYVRRQVALPPDGRRRLTEQQIQRFRRDFPGLDIPWLEREFQDWIVGKEQPRDYAAAFYGFMKHKKDEMDDARRGATTVTSWDGGRPRRPLR